MEIIGHRGAAGHAPENSAAGIAAGLRLGATAIGLDIQFSRDAVPMVFHDQSLERAAGVKGRVRDQSARELSGYDVGFRRGDAYRGLRLLTLEEAISLIPAGVDLHLGLAEFDPVTSRQLKELVDVATRRGGLGRYLISSSSAKVLAALRSVEAKTRRSLWTSAAPGDRTQEASSLGCEAIYAEAAQTAPEFVERCRAAGLKVYAYGADDPRLIQKLSGMGIDGLASSFPERLAEAGVAPRTRTATHRHRETAPSPPPQVAAPRPERAGEREDAATADGQPRKRRRGRRGGRKVRARREGAAGRPEAAAPTPIAEHARAHPAREAAVPPSKALRESESAAPAPPATRATPAAEAGGSAPPAAKKRRRGHRGGKRHRLRRLRKQGALPPEPGTGPDSGQD